MILLLGATGLLGHNVLKLLLSEGRRVRCIVRQGSKIDPEVLACAPQGALDIVYGSALDTHLLMEKLWGCDVAINCTGITDMTLSKAEDYKPVNVDLPLTLARLMHETGGHTLIDISSANTVDPGTAESPSNEETPFGGPFSASLYARSKRESEQALLRFAAEHRSLRTVIILPGFMVGPYDRKPSSGRLLLAAYRKPIMAVPAGGKSFIDVRDVASAVAGAIDNPLAAGRYLTTGKSMTLKEFYSLQAEVCGYRQACVVLPRGLCLVAGGVGDKMESRGHNNLFVSRNVRQLLIEEWYDDSRARKELGMTDTPLAQSIKDFFAYHDKH